eukprot:366269-Chlamydomonas_euryale.AAC.9
MSGLVGSGGRNFGLQDLGDVGESGWRRMRCGDGVDFSRVKFNLEANGFIVEPDFKVSISRVPSDSRWSSIRAAMESIQAPQAWDLHTGSGDDGPVVCVIDTGINLNHPDLRANIDARLGHNAITDTDRNCNDDNSHGSHCAGE